jgi:hypothetical protein
MDPYIERRAIWPDFHDALISYICEFLQPALRPKYAALGQKPPYMVEHERSIRPDVAVIRTSFESQGGRVATAVAVQPDRPLVIETITEEIREPLLHIIEPAAGNRIITSIEVLSPDNKRGGPGRASFLQKRSELIEQGANTVEIDLLRDGFRAIDPLPAKLEDTPGWHYLVSVHRAQTKWQEYYPIALRDRLPRVAIPLANGDPDVVLQLDAAFARCWEAGPYPELLGYEGSPPGNLDETDLAWCRETAAKLQFGAATKRSAESSAP